MLTYRCSAGHAFPYTFVGEQVRHPCPTCGVDVYKFRDRPIEDDETPSLAVEDSASSLNLAVLLKSRQALFAAAGTVVLAAAVAWAIHRPTSSALPVSQGAVIPAVAVQTSGAASKPASTGNAADVSITNFKAVPTDAGTVQVSLSLTNRPGSGNDYPNLVVHWHGITSPDQVIGRDAYNHPALPFINADVTLELELPSGATGLDIKIAY